VINVRDTNTNNGEAFAVCLPERCLAQCVCVCVVCVCVCVCVCVDANPHVLASDSLKVEHSNLLLVLNS